MVRLLDFRKALGIGDEPNHKERVLPVTTHFKDVLPGRIVGRLIASLHKALSQIAPEGKLIRRDAALIIVPQVGRVIVEFKRDQKILVWIFRGDQPIMIARKCLLFLDDLLKRFERGGLIGRQHIVFYDCVGSSDACRRTRRVLMELKDEWLRGRSSPLPIRDLC